MNGVKRKVQSVPTLLLAICLLGCQKQDIGIRKGLPITPVSIQSINGIFPTVLKKPLAAIRCINSYQAFIDALGSSSLSIRAVVLANGATINIGNDLRSVSYQAIPSSQSNSIFDSFLSVDWRFPNDDWQTSTENVWSVGCMLDQTGQPPYTNLMVGRNIFIINTSFYWLTNENTGEHINYLVAQ